MPDTTKTNSVAVDGRVLLTEADLVGWRRDGYVIVRGLWSPEEVAACRTWFDELGERGEAVPGQWEPDLGSTDPLKRYPRHLQPHVYDDLSMRMLIDARIEAVIAALLGEPPIAAQSMFYYKPPGGLGQALHQDNLYLRVRPKTCVAAWTAIDRSHPENGGLYICPGTQDMALACPELANPKESFTSHFVRPPAGIEPVPAILDPGDVLFFGGSIVHGSRPNTTRGEWRRSFICHYAPESLEVMAEYYRAAVRFDGTPFGFELAEGGGPCGVEFPNGEAPTTFEQAEAMGLKPVASGSIPAAV
ncbi:MAG: phytanoyl-CoA dioxygenase family protein [Planctomycetota bacterium]